MRALVIVTAVLCIAILSAGSIVDAIGRALDAWNEYGGVFAP